MCYSYVLQYTCYELRECNTRTSIVEKFTKSVRVHIIIILVQGARQGARRGEGIMNARGSPRFGRRQVKLEGFKSLEIVVCTQFLSIR